MDKSVVFAVSGAGKTTRIVDTLDLERRFLLVTYTNNNYENLRRKITKKYGYLPNNIVIKKYVSFLYGFCCRPFIGMTWRTRGLTFDRPPDWAGGRQGADSRGYFLGTSGRLYHNRIAKLLVDKGFIEAVKARIEKYFDVVCIDEIQDFGGHDFDFLMHLCSCNLQLLLVGDFFQHTFSTSHDGNKGKGLYDDYELYKKRFEKVGVHVDTTSLKKSYRCSPTVCAFIREHLGIDIESHSTIPTETRFLASQEDATAIHGDAATIKLFYNQHHDYGCYSQTWGASKGDDHHIDVCVVLTGTAHESFNAKRLGGEKPTIRNKLYVAFSRARGNLYLAQEQFFKGFKAAPQVKVLRPKKAAVKKRI